MKLRCSYSRKDPQKKWKEKKKKMQTLFPNGFVMLLAKLLAKVVAVKK
jgi:hypothetical protein